jgi:hypothetical protein
MTQLLDLPPEMFKNIVHELNTEPPNSTWKLRGVCHTFAAEIEHDLLSNQSKSVVEEMYEVINNNMAKYLLNRIHSPPDSEDRLLKTLRNMADYLMQELAIPEKEQEETETGMIEGFVRVCHLARINSMISHSSRDAFVFRRSLSNIDNGAELDYWQKVVAAMSFLAFHLVRALLVTTPPDIWILEITIGRSPLVMAVTANDDGLFDEVMGHLNHLRNTAKRDAVFYRYSYRFDDAFLVAVNSGNTRFVKELVEFCQKAWTRHSDEYIQPMAWRRHCAFEHGHCQVGPASRSLWGKGQFSPLHQGMPYR